ncbi:MAG TPA: DUF1810 domain-containing protein [Solirubrobacteraceae bacterium]|nr:DUF1810 domain-containing protein [Solirubrobacteraceae bacterium]
MRSRRGSGGDRLSASPDLQRFRDAQAGGTYARALAELRAGRKTGHWMWFIFPQLSGLGRSATARHYALQSLAHARAYLADPVLGPRLRGSCQALLGLPAGATAEGVLGSIDALKLRSCATLFARAGAEEGVFGDILERFYGGGHDEATLRLLERASG